MATTSKRAIFPFTEQEPFLSSEHRYYAYVSGVGAGKTHGGMQRVYHNMERWNVGEMGAIVAPTTTMIKDVILPLMREFGLMERWEYKSMHTDEPGIHAPNGSRALILSADNQRTIERLAGLNLAWWWLDEGSRVNERAFEILTQRLRIGEYQNGFVTTTPMGKNYLYDFFVDEETGTSYQHGEADVHEHSSGDRLALLRVPTWANPFTGEEYKQDMEAKEGQVYEQEILGRFVDFRGRVYPWFDDSRLRTERKANIKRMAYGVDWGHTNPFAIAAWALTNRNEWVCVDEVYETGLDYDDMVDAARGLQERHKPGVFYCGPDEPAAITMFKRAGLDARKAENAVLPGIQFVSSLRDRFYVLERCQHLINELNSYHYDEDSDSENPVEVNDHLCFVAGTQIETPDGQRPIETVEAGDKVLTRSGYRPVIEAGLTQRAADVVRLTTTDGRELIGTPDHPIHTPEGFKQLGSLSYGEVLSTLETMRNAWRESKKSSTKASRSGVTRTPTTVRTGTTTAPVANTSKTASKRSTARYGKTTTARYLTGSLSITKTATPITTTSEIWNVSLTPSTLSDTRKWASHPTLSNRGLKPRKSGISPKKAGNGTPSIGINRWQKYSTAARNVNATNAENYSPTEAHNATDGFAQMPVRLSGGGTLGLMMRSASARRAGSRLPLTNTATSEPVRVDAVEPLSHGRNVYNLTVEGQPEYFANGILAHNCDASRYALFTAAQHGGASTGVVPAEKEFL